MTINHKVTNMKSIDNLNVGAKFGTEHFAVECKLLVPENLADCKTLAKGSEPFIAQMFERGWRIWNQEQTGARDIVRESTVAQRKDVATLTARVQLAIDSADPLSPPKRTGRPATPKDVKVDAEIAKAMKAGDTAKLTELLAAQGIKINFQK